MKKILFFSEKGTADKNEDMLGSYNNVVWVIDGATPLFKKLFFSKDNDVVWIVEEINRWLPFFIQDNLSLEEILKLTLEKIKSQAIEIYPDLHHLPQYELPTFTIALIRLIHNTLEYYILGDCGLLIKHDKSIQYITDDRLEQLSNKLRQGKSNRNNQTPMLQEIRKLLNKENGYWIGSIDGKGVVHGFKGSIRYDESLCVIGFSDGYSRLFETNQFDIQNIEFDVNFIRQSINMIREIENNDKECKLIPRVKCSDDLSVFIIEN